MVSINILSAVAKCYLHVIKIQIFGDGTHTNGYFLKNSTMICGNRADYML